MAESVLELRIHGVNNTTPHDMLELSPEQVQQVDGDDLGSFWSPRPTALAALDPADPGAVPRGVRRQAYSWGGLARTSVSVGGGAIGSAATAAARLGWALLLPFGLVNVAYWTRRLDDGRRASGARGTGRPRPGAISAAASRLFGLLLTLLLVVTACELALDLFAHQCFAVADVKRCTALPSLLDVFATWRPSARLALGSLVPVGSLLGLRLLGRISSARYETVTVVERPNGSTAGGGGTGDSTPVRNAVILARPDFWRGAQRAEAAASLHLAAGSCVVVLASAWPARVTAPGRPVPLIMVLLAGGVLLAAAVTLVWGSGDAADLREPRQVAASWWRAGVFGAAVALLSLEIVLLWQAVPGFDFGSASTTARPDPLPGYDLAPAGLLLALTALAGWALAWRGRPPTGGVGREHSIWRGTAPGVLLLLSLATAMMLSSLVVLTIGNWLNGIRSTADLFGPPSRPDCGVACAGVEQSLSVPGVYIWFGAASAVGLVLMVAMLAALALSWGAQSVLVAARRPVPRSMLGWYFWSRSGRRHEPGRTEPGLVQTIRELAPRRAASRMGLLRFEDAAVLAEPSDARVGSDVAAVPGAALLAPAQSSRTRAAIAQHAEVLVAVLAAVAGIVVLLTLVELARGWRDARFSLGVEHLALSAGPAGVALIGAAVAGGVAGGGVLRGQRPLGLVWDLICVLPRAAHPLGPPCYAERAVPEVVRRTLWFLDGETAEAAARRNGPLPGRRVILSAHSLGCVLAVAAICALPRPNGPVQREPDRVPQPDQVREPDRVPKPDQVPEPRPALYTDHVWLITYGCQLRAYFGRLFPELLGAAALGTSPCRAPSSWALDPWMHQSDEPARPGTAVDPTSPTVRDLLTDASGAAGRWVNLWRRTDHLGFPVLGWRRCEDDPGNDIDRPAEELDTSGYVAAVASHGNYPRTLAYAVVLAEQAPRPEPVATSAQAQ